MKRRIICVGSIVQDEVYHMEQLPSAGIKMDSLRVEDRFGGPAATAAVAIAKLGGVASFWGRVGKDATGDAAVAALKATGVDCSGVAVIEGGRTRRAVVMVDGKGERCIVTYRRGLEDQASLLPRDSLDDVAVLLGDSRWPIGADAAIARAREKGIATIADIDGGDRAMTLKIVEMTDHVIFSSEGLRDYAGEGSPAEQLKSLPIADGQVLAVTRGSAGSLWRIGGVIETVPAFEVAVEDTTGCGDVFHGAYALAIAEGMTAIVAARFAAAAAAIKAQRGRGWLGMPDRSAVEEMLKSGA